MITFLFENYNWKEYFGVALEAQAFTQWVRQYNNSKSFEDYLENLSNDMELSFQRIKHNMTSIFKIDRMVSEYGKASLLYYLMRHETSINTSIKNSDDLSSGYAEYATNLLKRSNRALSKITKYSSDELSSRDSPITKIDHFYGTSSTTGMSTNIPELLELVQTITPDTNINEFVTKATEIENDWIRIQQSNNDKPLSDDVEIVNNMYDIGDQYLKPDEYSKHTEIEEAINNYSWWNVDNRSCSYEARAAGHCGSGEGDELYSFRYKKQFYVKSEEEVITVLRPLLTASVTQNTIVELRANGNQKPAEKYHPAIIRLIEELDIDKIARPSYRPEDTFSLSDLEETVRKKILKTKPELLDDFEKYMNGESYGLSMTERGYALESIISDWEVSVETNTYTDSNGEKQSHEYFDVKLDKSFALEDMLDKDDYNGGSLATHKVFGVLAAIVDHAIDDSLREQLFYDVIPYFDKAATDIELNDYITMSTEEASIDKDYLLKGYAKIITELQEVYEKINDNPDLLIKIYNFIISNSENSSYINNLTHISNHDYYVHVDIDIIDHYHINSGDELRQVFENIKYDIEYEGGIYLGNGRDYYIDEFKPIIDLHPIFEAVQRPNSISDYTEYLVKYVKYAITQSLRDPNQLDLFKDIDDLR